MDREEIRRKAQERGATNPGLIPISKKRFRKLVPEYFGWRGAAVSLLSRTRISRKVDEIADYLHHGDGQPAVVISTKPLRVAAYSIDLDAIALLRFPHRLVKEFDLEEGTRLLSTNSYKYLEDRDEDLTFGPEYMGAWGGFWPIIADFLTEDRDAIEECKARIPKHLWKRAEDFGHAWFRERPHFVRDGDPVFSKFPAEQRPLGSWNLD